VRVEFAASAKMVNRKLRGRTESCRCQTISSKSYASRLRRRSPRPGDKRHLDEVFIRIEGVQHYLWRAVDRDGVVLDILVHRGGTPKPPGTISGSVIHHAKTIWLM
jgi:hypothetical protein